MKWNDPVRFIGETFEDLKTYFFTQINASLRDLSIVMENLTFEDNFTSFLWTGTLAAGAEAKIKNALGLKVKPSKWIVVRLSGGFGLVEGPTAWTTDYVYLKNSGATTLTATVVFLK